MFATLSRYDRITAAGILARAAFSLDGAEYGNPAAIPQDDEEVKVRQRLFVEARAILGLEELDNSQSSLERVSDLLDQESDAILEPVDEEQTLKKLADKGDLPSDLFNIQYSNVLIDILKEDFIDEQFFISETIKKADQFQNLEPGQDEGEDSFMISLFAKQFKGKYPINNFTMLVAGQRSGLNFHVMQAWRISPHLVDTSGSPQLVDLLRRFADVFGIEMTVGKKRAKFFYSAEIPPDFKFESSLELSSAPKYKTSKSTKKSEIAVTQIFQKAHTGRSTHAALVMAIDVVKYNRSRLTAK
jgi:hypothetical protein